MLVQRKKKKKKKKDELREKWTKQQKENFVCFGDIWYQSHVKTIMSQNIQHQLQTYPSLSNSSSNNQCCNSSQHHNPNNQCFCLSCPSYCHHNFRPLSLTSPHYCRCRLFPEIPHRELLSCRHHLDAHRRFKNVASQPFRKTMSQLRQDDRDLRT